MEKPDYYFHVADPEIIGNVNSRNVILRFQTVESKDNRSQRSGKHIHLELTNEFAMRLLGQLEAARKVLGLPPPAEPERIDVPPQKDRN